MKTNVGRGPVLCLAICETVLKNIRKKYLRISPKCWCFLIVLMSRNELGDGIAVGTCWFRVLWRHSNTVYGGNISCVCGELRRMWYWMWLEKVEPWGRHQVQGGHRFRGSSQWGIESGEYKLIWWLIRWIGHRVLCKTRQKLVFR